MKLRFNDQEFDSLVALAQRENKSPETWLLEKVKAQLPIWTRDSPIKNRRAEIALELVYEELEAQEKLTEYRETLHPCGYLDPRVPPNWSGQCSGVCKHPDLKGQICHWVPERAHECQFFRRKPMAPNSPESVIIRR